MSRLLRPARIVFLLALVVPLAASAEQSATYYFHYGNALLKRGQPDEAIASYSKAIELQPRIST